jgi:hypothetical protein
LIAALVSTTNYSKTYLEHVLDFVSFAEDRYRKLEWNGNGLKYFARAERERIRLYRTTVHQLFESRCMIQAWTSCDGESKNEEIRSLRQRVADGIAKLQQLYKDGPLVGIMGAAFHTNDAYFRALQKPQRRPSPWQFGRCLYPDCSTDAVHIITNCPAFMTSINQIQPLKTEDDDSQGWDGTAFAAMADAYVRCALAGLMPTINE